MFRPLLIFQTLEMLPVFPSFPVFSGEKKRKIWRKSCSIRTACRSHSSCVRCTATAKRRHRLRMVVSTPSHCGVRHEVVWALSALEANDTSTEKSVCAVRSAGYIPGSSYSRTVHTIRCTLKYVLYDNQICRYKTARQTSPAEQYRNWGGKLAIWRQ